MVVPAVLIVEFSEKTFATRSLMTKTAIWFDAIDAAVALLVCGITLFDESKNPHSKVEHC